MTEPSSPAVGIGVLAAFLAALGIGPQPLFWALIGTTAGMSFAPQTSRLRACITFGCATLASALLGTYGAQVYLDKAAPIAANVASLVMGALFQPLLAAASNAVPTIINAALKRFGFGGETP